MRWLIVLLLLGVLTYLDISNASAVTEKQQLLRIAEEIEERKGPYEEGQHCRTNYHDDGTETKECQDMKDVHSPTGLMFNCKGIGKQLVCNPKK